MTEINALPLVDENTRRKSKRLLLKEIVKEVKTQGGIITPNSPIMQCTVIGKDIDSDYEFGEVVTIRRSKNPTEIIYEGSTLIVIYEMEVVNNNKKTGAHTIIVRIDKQKRDLLQEKTETGIYLPQSKAFQAMKYNLQYGEVIEIGSQAQLRYPDLHVGETAIIYHTVESQDHRLLKVDVENKIKITHEYRIINTADNTNREILGKIDLKTQAIAPMENFVFLEDDFDITWHDHNTYNLKDYHDIASLNNRLKHIKEESVLKFQGKTQSMKTEYSKINPYINRQRDFGDAIDTAMTRERNDITEKAAGLNRDFFLCCKIAFSNATLWQDCEVLPLEKVIAPSKILYPLTLLGKKYLICKTSDLVAVVN